MKFVEDYANAYVQNGKLYNYSVRDLFNNVSILVSILIVYLATSSPLLFLKSKLFKFK